MSTCYSANIVVTDVPDCFFTVQLHTARSMRFMSSFNIYGDATLQTFILIAIRSE